mgnify:CR=1 FL=1
MYEDDEHDDDDKIGDYVTDDDDDVGVFVLGKGFYKKIKKITTIVRGVMRLMWYSKDKYLRKEDINPNTCVQN